MRVIKCDLCKRKVKGEPVTAGLGLLPRIELCHDCGAPILIFLKKKKLIESGEYKKK